MALRRSDVVSGLLAGGLSLACDPVMAAHPNHSPDPAGDAPAPDVLDEAICALTQEVPERAARAIRWLIRPQARWIRIPAGLACILAAVFWFLPVIGIEFLPVGLLLLAYDVPFLRRPVGLLLLKLVSLWRRFKARRKKRS